MGNIGMLLRLIADGASLREAWKEAGYPSMERARAALVRCAENLDTFHRAAGPAAKAASPVSAGAVDVLIVNTDGASRGNPGPASVAAVAYLPSGELLTSVSEPIGRATNNVAEYRAVLVGLDLAHRLGAKAVQIRLDSELVVKQLNGEYRVKKDRLRSLHRAVLTGALRFSRCTFSHVPRTQNVEADRLANEALDVDGAPHDPSNQR